MGRGATRCAPGVRLLLPAVAFLLFSTTLRAPVTAVPPLVGRIGDDLGMGPAALGMLTSIPVLFFGVLTPAASALLRRVGVNSGVVWTLALIALGSLVRSSGQVWTVFAGTAIIGAGITIGNLVAPMVIGRDFRRRAAVMTGMYSAAMNIVITASTALAVPLAVYIGWKGSAAAWGVLPALLAVLVWVLVFAPGGDSARAWVTGRAPAGAGSEDTTVTASGTGALRMDTPGAGASILRWPLAWIMAVAFACHNFSYYALSTWLPTALGEMRGLDDVGAGVAASVFQFTGTVGPLLVPVMLNALGWSTQRMMVVVGVCWLVLPLGLVALPQAWLVWCVVSGFAQGAFFTSLFTIIIQRTRNVDENRQLSALVQTLGYGVAAAGPVVMGALHGAIPGWTVPLLVIAGMLLVMLVCSIIVARDTSSPPVIATPEGKRP